MGRLPRSPILIGMVAMLRFYRHSLAHPWVAALLVFLFTAGAAASLIWRLDQHRLEEERLRVADLAGDYAQAVQRHIEHALSATYALAALVHQGHGAIHDFEAVGTQILPFYPGVANLNLSPNGVIQQIAPLAGNEKAIGFNQLQDPAQSREAWIARNTGKLTLAGPFELIEGGLGAVGRLPVFLNDANGQPDFWGFTNVVIRLPEALNPARLPQLAERGFAYRLWRIHPDSQETVAIAASSPNALINPVERTLLVPNGRWILSVSPIHGWNDLPGFTLKAALGLLISLLLAYLAKVLVELKAHQQGLAALVVQRTGEATAVRRQLESIFAALPDPLWVKDGNGCYLSCNPQFERLIGLKQAEIVGKTDYDFMDRERADLLRDHDQKVVLAGKSSVNEEWISFAGNGYGGLFETVKTPMLDMTGKLIGVLGIARNITERKRAEEQLRITLQRMDTLISSLYAGVLLVSEDDQIEFVNQAFCDLFGLAENPERLRGLSAQDMIQKTYPIYADPTDALLRIQDIIAQGQPVRGEELLMQGGRLHVRDFIPVFIEGQRYGRLWHHVDITERKWIEAELRIAATAFEAQESIIIADANNEILRINQAFTETTGYSARDAVGQTPCLLRSDRHDAAFYAAMWDSIIHKGTWQGEIWNRRKNGEIFPAWLTITAVKDDRSAVTHYVGTMIDITKRKAAEDKVKYLAFYDPLTQLPNRQLLLERLEQALAASAGSQRHGALLLIDLDNFKTLNDTLGHGMGDLLLQQVAKRLIDYKCESEAVTRLGGDEFVVMLENLSDAPGEAARQAETVGQSLIALLTQTYLLAGYEHYSTSSIGVTLFNGYQESVAELLKRVDFAMYQAKAAGRNTMRFFDPAMQAAVTARAVLEVDLRDAVREGQFLLYYQAQVDGAGDLIGAEALVRWRHPRRGMVSPAEFIPLAEETGLILPLGHWVLETACKQLIVWAAQPEMAHLALAVNVSARQFRHPDFVAQVRAVLDHSGANPEKLKLELTESLLVANMEDIIAKMTALRAWGVGFSLDDFGTGYSSLAYLKRLPLDQLKIDQSFVRDILTDPNDAAIARTIVALAHSLGLAVIAEGVETEAQRDFLTRNGCHAFQGYLFGRPGPAENLL